MYQQNPATHDMDRPPLGPRAHVPRHRMVPRVHLLRTLENLPGREQRRLHRVYKKTPKKNKSKKQLQTFFFFVLGFSFCVGRTSPLLNFLDSFLIFLKNCFV
jgi:hypothetical protein